MNIQGEVLVTHSAVHLVVSDYVLVEGPQHDHGHHTRQEEDNHKRVHDTANITGIK